MLNQHAVDVVKTQHVGMEGDSELTRSMPSASSKSYAVQCWGKTVTCGAENVDGESSKKQICSCCYYYLARDADFEMIWIGLVLLHSGDVRRDVFLKPNAAVEAGASSSSRGGSKRKKVWCVSWLPAQYARDGTHQNGSSPGVSCPRPQRGSRKI